MKRWLLVLALLGAEACSGMAAEVRRAASQGDLPTAMRRYAEYVDERGEGDPDLLAEVALSVLRDAAASRDVRERSAGFSALRGLGVHARDVLDELARRPDVVGDRAAAALFELDGRNGDAPARLRAASRSDDPERRIAGMVALRGPAGLRRLIRCARDPEAAVRAAATRELARRRGDADAAAALVERLRDDVDAAVRTAAVQALGAHGEAGVDALRAALDDRDPIVRMSAASALVAAAPEAAVEALASRLTPEVTNASIEIARVLATRHHAPAEAYIVEALHHARAALRPQAAVAAQALSEGRDDDLRPLLHDADPEVALRIASLLSRRAQLRDEALAALRPLAMSPDGFVAVRALGVIANAGDLWAREPLRAAFQSSDANVRRLAVIAWPQAIGPRGGDVDPLVPLLRDADRSVALLAAVEVVLIAAR